MKNIVEAVKKVVVEFLVNQVLTKENVEKWITERLDEAVAKARATPSTTDDVIVERIRAVWEEIKSA